LYGEDGLEVSKAPYLASKGTMKLFEANAAAGNPEEEIRRLKNEFLEDDVNDTWDEVNSL
jgi:hypothetical protein